MHVSVLEVPVVIFFSLPYAQCSKNFRLCKAFDYGMNRWTAQVRFATNSYMRITSNDVVLSDSELHLFQRKLDLGADSNLF